MPTNTPITTTDTVVPRVRLGLVLWLAGMLGVVTITVTVLPRSQAANNLAAFLRKQGEGS